MEKVISKNFRVHYCKNFASQIISTDSRHCGLVEAMPKFHISPSHKLRKNMILNHAAADTAVQ